jgi:glycosyltransferase involved in cell wall biosynthesis
MRLRLVVPIDVAEPTGGNVYDLAIANALRRGGDDVDLIVCAPEELAAALRASSSWRGRVLVDGLLACPRPGALAGAGAGVLVHMPMSWGADAVGVDPAQLDLLEAEALEAASLVVATSHWSAQYLERRHGTRDIAVVPPGVDPADVVDGSDPPLIAHVAALMPHKNQRGLVAALAQVADLPWQARLAGSLDRSPGYAAEVRTAVEAAQLTDRIELAGAVSREAAWAGADLAVLPSLVEAYGMVVTEALARGVPVVVADGGPAEALGVDPEGRRPGVVVPRDDPAALAAELRRWLTQPAHRAELRRRALARRTNLDTWDAAAHKLRQTLQNATRQEGLTCPTRRPN